MPLYSDIAQAIIKLTIFASLNTHVTLLRWLKHVLMRFHRFSTLTGVSANTLRRSPKEMRVRADECERLADSLTPTPDDLRKMLREIAAQWRRLPPDGEAHPKTPGLGRAAKHR